MRSGSRPGSIGLLPASGRLRAVFLFALVCLGLGCLLSTCFVLSIPPESSDDFGTLLNVGIVILSPFWGFSALVLLIGAYRQTRPGPRALAWGAMSLTSLLPTIFALNATADKLDSFALCGAVCLPFVLVLIALTFYHWRKARADIRGVSAPPPKTAPPPASEPARAQAVRLDPEPQSDLSEWATNLNLSGSMADDEVAEWLKNVNRPAESKPPTTPVSQTKTPPIPPTPLTPNSESDLPAWLRAMNPPGVDAPVPPAKPAASESSVSLPADEALTWLESLAAKHGATDEELITQPKARTEAPPAWVKSEPSGIDQLPPIPDSTSMPDSQTALDQLSQALKSSKQALDDLLHTPLPEIGTTAPPDAGANQKTGAKKNQCPHCGTELQSAPGQGFIFCYHCGSQVDF